MTFSEHDRNVLRKLAGAVAEIASLAKQKQTIDLWKANNSLKPVRPMVMIDQMPWHELDVDGELQNQCADPFARWLETQMRQQLYRWKHMPADFVVRDFICVPKVIHNSGFGITIRDEQAPMDPQNDVVGHAYIDQVKTEADIEKIRVPEVRLDEEATARREEMVNRVFAGILKVKMEGDFAWFTPWDLITTWRNPESVLSDLVERPEFMHKLIAKVIGAATGFLDQLEAMGLLGCERDWIHCTGAFTDELPAKGFDPKKPRAKDNWTCSAAQIFGSVSPAMHDEFEVQYMIPWYQRWGLVYYGCCEPLDDRLDVVRKIPNLRKISMSPWVNVERGAKGIGPDYVFSRKPSPTPLAGDSFDARAVENDLRATRKACREHGCPLEFILKDISTVRYDPGRLWEWEKIAMRVAQE